MEQKQRQRYLESVNLIVAEMQLLSLAKRKKKKKGIRLLAQESPRLLPRLRQHEQVQYPVKSNTSVARRQARVSLENKFNSTQSVAQSQLIERREDSGSS